MPEGRGARFAVETVFLFAVAGALALAQFRPLWIVVVMLAAWVIVALLEWAAWRDRPHWARGAPPRYYVPEQPLPPRRPSTELPSFSSYPRPAPREAEAPTWIATPELRAEVYGWPALESDGEEEGVAAVVDEQPVAPAEPQTTVEELPEELLAEAAPDPPEPQPDDRAPALPAPRPARHRIDPFAEADAPRRRWRRRADESTFVELQRLPRHVQIAPRFGEEPRG